MNIVHVAAGILTRPDGQFLLASRPTGKVYAGFWEFPGGKLEAGETAHDALIRELHEEMGIRVTEATPWVVQTFTYPHATVRLHFFLVTAWEEAPIAREGQQFAWQRSGSLTASPILPANGPILRGLAQAPTLTLSNVAGLGQNEWLERLDRALENGLQRVLLREPQLSKADYATLARQVISRSAAHGCDVILHSHADLVHELGAPGLHLPARSAAQQVRRPDGLRWFGVSTHNLAELQTAQQLGVDYALLGHVQATASHPGESPLGWDGLATLVAEGWPFPVYALGGMMPADVPTARLNGAHGVAMLSAAWS
ncbi:Nudix family hydrolase [Chitinibacteraceae bacterium HSL-7]